MSPDRYHVDFEVFGFENDFGAGDGELAEAAVAEAAPYHDVLGHFQAFSFRKRRVT